MPPSTAWKVKAQSGAEVLSVAPYFRKWLKTQAGRCGLRYTILPHSLSSEMTPNIGCVICMEFDTHEEVTNLINLVTNKKSLLHCNLVLLQKVSNIK